MKRSVVIIGAGPSALMLAAQLDEKKFDVHLYEKNAAAGRKFLVAGEGGLNITHSEPADLMLNRYIPREFFTSILQAFSNRDLCEWLSEIGIPTYTGSSKRIFPVKGLKPIEALNKILDVLKKRNVSIHTRHEWKGWKDNQLLFTSEGREILVVSDITVFSLGGGSWKVTGSDGSWTSLLREKNITVLPFEASNCEIHVSWKSVLLEAAEGKAVKNIMLRCGEQSKKGEVVITAKGLEGGAVYALSHSLREQLKSNGQALLYMDLKPDASEEEIMSKLKDKGNRSRSTQLKEKLKLSDPQLMLLKTLLTKEEYTGERSLAHAIKNLPIIVEGTAGVDEAISTTGGISLSEVDANFGLNKLPGHYAIGEMLDWDAPTGGYLLQACFSMGYKLAHHLNKRSI